MKEPVTPGGRALRAWLDSKGLSIPTFAEQHGLQRVTVQRVISGERRRISVNLAMRIQRATGGGVPVEVWESDEPDETGPQTAVAAAPPSSSPNLTAGAPRKAAS